MPENIITIFDAITGEVTERAMTSVEIAEKEAIAQADQERIAQREAARQSALAKLAALGLTEEEIASL
jgi:hypothetical protein